MHKRLLFLCLLVITATLPGLVQAQENVYNETVRVPEQTVINDNFFRMGNTVTIDGSVNGDVITAGNTVTINGAVAGDVLAAGSTVTINGPVSGNVRVVAGDVTINSTIGKNVSVAAGTLTVNADAAIGWTLSFAGQTINIAGDVSGNVYSFAQSVAISSTVGNNTTLFLGNNGQVQLQDNAIVKGNFEYHSKQAADLSEKATVQGTITQKSPVWQTRETFSIPWVYTSLVSLFSLLLVGTVIVSLMPRAVKQVTGNMRLNPLTKGLWGLLALIIIPLVCFVLLFTIIGIPLAIIIAAFYAIALYSSMIFTGTVAGQYILKLFNQKKEKNKPLATVSMIWVMMLGTTILVLLTKVPILGGLIALASMVWFLGSLFTIFKNYLAAKQHAKTQQKNI